MTEVQDNYQYETQNKEYNDDNTNKDTTYDEESKLVSCSNDQDKEVIERDTHDRTFISKMYEMLLTTFPVQEKVKKISQPFINIYHDLLEDSINEFKDKSQELINNTKGKLTSWLYDLNIYSHLVGLWLLQHSPYIQDKTITEEEFLASSMNTEINKSIYTEEEINTISKTFYEIASAESKKLENPNIENIKHILLYTVARTISKITLELNDDTYATTLLDIYKEVIEKKHTLISNKEYLQLVQQKYSANNEALLDTTKFNKGTLDFYIFAKRFTLIDLPMVVHTTTSISKAISNFLQNIPRNYALNFLSSFEKYLDKAIYMLDGGKEGVKPNHQESLMSLKVRTMSIANKMLRLGTITYQKSMNYTQSTRLYLTTDKYLNYKERYNDLTVLACSSYDIFSNKVYQPLTEFLQNKPDKLWKIYQERIYEPVYAMYDKATQKYTVFIKNMNEDKELLKLRLNNMMKTSYEYLKEGTITIKQKVLEIKFDKDTIDKYRDQITQELEKLYQELQKMDLQEIKAKAADLYKQAITILKAKTQRKIII